MKQFYVYSVCLLCVVCGAISLGVGLWGIVRVSSPEITIGRRDWNRVASLQSYMTDKRNEKALKKLSKKEIEKRWEDAKETAIENERRKGIQNIITAIIWLIIVVPLFVVHWRLAGKLRKASV